MTHRDILPIAQEELFKRLDIKSNEQMDLLNRSIIESQRWNEYAVRTESIEFGFGVDMAKLMASGAFNPRELSSSSEGVKFSDLSRSRSNSAVIAVTDSNYRQTNSKTFVASILTKQNMT